MCYMVAALSLLISKESRNILGLDSGSAKLLMKVFPIPQAQALPWRMSSALPTKPNLKPDNVVVLEGNCSIILEEV